MYGLEQSVRKFCRTSSLSTRAKRIALVLATYADIEGKNIYPGIDVIKQDSGATKRTVIAALKELQEKHVLIREGRYIAKQHAYLNCYCFNLETIRYAPPRRKLQAATNGHTPEPAQALKFERLQALQQLQIPDQPDDFYQGWRERLQEIEADMQQVGG